MRKPYLRKSILLLVAALVVTSLSACTLATVRTLKEDEIAKRGFSGARYVDQIWDSEIIPTYREEAQDLTALLDMIRADEQAAIDAFGHRSGTGAYSFMVRGEGTIIEFDTSSRAGLVTLDLVPQDGTADVSLVVGPLIKISQRAAVRDAVGLIEYGDFTNQQEFADVANAMGDRIIPMIADALGAASPDAIGELDPAAVEGKTIRFIGAFELEDPENIVIVPVEMEVVE